MKLYPLTHNLAALLGVLSHAGIDVAPYRDLVEFNPFGVQFRYEELDEADEPLNRAAAVQAVENLVARVWDFARALPGDGQEG